MTDETPDYAAMLDKEMGGTPTPPVPVADTVTPEVPAQMDTPSGPDSGAVDAAGILRHADYTRKMQALAEERRRLEVEAERVRELEELRARLDSDPGYRDRFEQAWELANGQAAPAAPAQDAQLLGRINRLEQALARQTMDGHASMVEATIAKLAVDYGLSKQDQEAIVLDAVGQDLLGYGTPVELVEKRLRAVTASHHLPRAKADGQRELIGQIKDKGKVASPVTTVPAPPEAEPDVTKMKQQDYEAYLVKEAEKALGKS